jgi:hypothetical protein
MKNRPSDSYTWTTEEPTKEGFYIALKFDTFNPVVVVVLERDYEVCKVGAHAYIGPKDDCTYGSPSIRPMKEDFVMWSRLPEPFKEA